MGLQQDFEAANPIPPRPPEGAPDADFAAWSAAMDEWSARQNAYTRDHSPGGSQYEKGSGLGGTITPEQEAQADAEAAARAANDAAKAQAKAADDAYQGNFQYGGWAGGASEAANRYAKAGEWAQGREGEQIDYAHADNARNQGQGARQAQVGMYRLLANRAAGLTPSIAQMQADRQMRQASAEQSSAAASARGPAGLALAQQGAAANTAAMHSGISNQAQINAAGERLQAEKAAFDAASGMRGGDAQQQGLSAQQAQAQASINAAQRAQNDQYQLGMTGYETGVHQVQLGASGNKIASERGQAMNNSTIAANKDIASDNRSAATTTAVIGGGAALFGGAVATNLLGGGKADPIKGAGGVSGGDGGGHDCPPGTVWDADDQSCAPLASGGGGYDPDQLSDMRSKNIGSWDSAQQPAPRVGMSSMLANRAPTLPGPQRAIPTEPNRPGPQTLPGPQLPGPQRGMNRALMYSDEHAKDKCTSCAGEAKSPMYSDEHAKQAAYDQGRQHGVASTQAQPVYKKSDSPATRSQVLKDWQGGHGIKDATPMAEANRSMEATPYTYKPEFAARTGQEPGEKNVGPMAQRMAADPVAATAVERDPQTGMLTLDRDKLAKVTSGGVADLQQQMDQLREHIKNPPRSIMAQRFGAMRKR